MGAVHRLRGDDGGCMDDGSSTKSSWASRCIVPQLHLNLLSSLLVACSAQYHTHRKGTLMHRMNAMASVCLLCGLLLLMPTGSLALDHVSKPGGAGYALLFSDTPIILENMKDFAGDAMTFEAWIQTNDRCHHGAVLSYAKKAVPYRGYSDKESNHFVVYNQENLVACHDFEYINLVPDRDMISCYGRFNTSGKGSVVNLVSDAGEWHHLAVTWTAQKDGMTQIYMDGVLMRSVRTGKTGPLEEGGALVLGGEQDCYGGCLDRNQGFFGEMDEVRVWKVARTQEQILRHMRDGMGLDHHPDLVAYWKFNDPESDESAQIAKDSSGNENHLPLVTLPKPSLLDLTSPHLSKRVSAAGVLSFKNNYAMNMNYRGMPEEDFTVEFYARTPAYEALDLDTWSEFFSFAAFKGDATGVSDFEFLDDAILIEKYSKEYAGTKDLHFMDKKTSGSISVSINSNRQGMGRKNENWIDFAVEWTDGDWHHVAVSWQRSTGEVSLYFDGQKQNPFWVSNNGDTVVESYPGTGVHSTIATGTTRSSSGSLFLGAKQDGSIGGGLSQQYALKADMAQLRIWNYVLTETEIHESMGVKTYPSDKNGLAQQYDFSPENVFFSEQGANGYVKDTLKDKFTNNLYFGAHSPLWVYSNAPLANADGSRIDPPQPGTAGNALRLHEGQVLLAVNFEMPSEELTIEFWMLSVDKCNTGAPISYATEENDNMVMIGNYNDWIISIAGDEGTINDHMSGISSTDGRWHHIAVTWNSKTGETRLFDNGRQVWETVRAKNRKVQRGGTLVIGREQDCVSGCFDSRPGASGDITPSQLEYGYQDFLGLIDELRVWNRVRTGDEIRAGMRMRIAKSQGQGEKGINPKDPHLVAYYNFDEGDGYLIRDLTGRGNDLYLSRPPSFEIVRLFSYCGNGVLEPLEECDMGKNDGNGCDANCNIMEGWECTSTSPSVCWQKSGKHDDGHPYPSPSPGSLRPNPQPPSSKSEDGGNKDTHHGSRLVSGIMALLAVTTIAGSFAAAYMYRQALFERYPQLEDLAIRLKQKLVGLRYKIIPGSGLDMTNVDMTSPDFTESVPLSGRPYSEIPSRHQSDDL